MEELLNFKYVLLAKIVFQDIDFGDLETPQPT